MAERNDWKACDSEGVRSDIAVVAQTIASRPANKEASCYRQRLSLSVTRWPAKQCECGERSTRNGSPHVICNKPRIIRCLARTNTKFPHQSQRRISISISPGTMSFSLLPPVRVLPLSEHSPHRSHHFLQTVKTRGPGPPFARSCAPPEP